MTPFLDIDSDLAALDALPRITEADSATTLAWLRENVNNHNLRRRMGSTLLHKCPVPPSILVPMLWARGEHVALVHHRRLNASRVSRATHPGKSVETELVWGAPQTIDTYFEYVGMVRLGRLSILSFSQWCGRQYGYGEDEIRAFYAMNGSGEFCDCSQCTPHAYHETAHPERPGPRIIHIKTKTPEAAMTTLSFPVVTYTAVPEGFRYEISTAKGAFLVGTARSLTAAKRAVDLELKAEAAQ